MPRYIQPILIDGKRYYAVFSTITMQFLTPPYPSIKELKHRHPEYSRLKVVRHTLRGKINDNGNLDVSMPVHVISIDKSKRKRQGKLDRYVIYRLD